LISGPDYNGGESAAWLFANWLMVYQFSPTSGPTTGGTTVTITGIGFSNASAVRFGSRRAASYTVDSNSQITAVSPPGNPGTVDVTVTTSAGTSPTGGVVRNAFTYADADGVAPMNRTLGTSQ
jgi:hypothetical protein